MNSAARSSQRIHLTPSSKIDCQQAMANACFAVRAFGLVLDGRGAMSGLLPLQPSTRDGFRALDGRLTGRSTNVPTRREESATSPAIGDGQ